VLSKIVKSSEHSHIKRAAKILNAGGVIIYPTETLYGIGCISNNTNAYKRIYKIKNRDYSMPFPVLVKDFDMLYEYAYVPKGLDELLSNFLPGPLTLILNIRKKIFPDISKEDRKAALRISKHPFVDSLFGFINKPLISTSANISGSKNLFDIKDIEKEFTDEIDLIIDSGTISASKGSTIVDFTISPPKIIREGDIPVNTINKFL